MSDINSLVPRGWQPTTSTSAGALLGGAAAQLICAALTHFAHLPLDNETVASITTLAVFAAGYLLPDGGRR